MSTRPLNQIAQLWDELYQTRMPIPKNATVKELDQLMEKRHERGQYINWLTHFNDLGSWGAATFINSLAGM